MTLNTGASIVKILVSHTHTSQGLMEKNLSAAEGARDSSAWHYFVYSYRKMPE